MATYFVRKSGNDSNTTVQAQVAATAWLTIDKAANEVAAGDTVVVGAGVYRELVTMDTAGTSSLQITFVADVDGSLGSGDPGLVIISAYADEQSAATRLSCIDTNEKDFITWQGFVMTGGTSRVVGDAGTGNVNYEGCIWEDCVFITGHDDPDYCFYLDFNAALTPTNNGPIWRRCIFNGAGITLTFDENATAETDLKATIESCVFVNAAGSGTNSRGVFLNYSATDTYSAGGVSINNCTFTGMAAAVYVENGTSTTYPIEVTNCVFTYCVNCLYKETSNDGALTSAYNTFAVAITDYSNVTTGTGDRSQATDPGLMGGVGDYPLHRFWGWSPYRPWEPIRLQDDAYKHSVVGDGDTSTAAATDLYDEAKPMYGTVDDRGAVEGRARPEQETTTVRTGANAIRFEGAGFHDMILPVEAALTTVDVYAQYDATYSGTLPQLKALNIPGVADQTDTQTGGSGSWEKLTVTFTPTSAGIARIRLVSSDTSAAGECFFDDLAIS